MTEVAAGSTTVGRRLPPKLLLQASGTLLLNSGTLVINFAITLALSRFLGADGYGAYAFAFAWAALLSAVAGLGLSALVVRVTASAHALGRWGLLHGMLRWSN